MFMEMFQGGNNKIKYSGERYPKHTLPSDKRVGTTGAELDPK